MTTGRFTLSPATTALLADLGVPTAAVLRAAGLPEDLLHQRAALSPEQFYRCWTALAELSGDPALGVTLAERTRAETFQPVVFAALCSPDLAHAAERLVTHKRLLGPLPMAVEAGPGELALSLRWPPDPLPPNGFVGYELASWVALARLGTRARIVPRRVGAPEPPRGPAADAFRDYLGVPVTRAAAPVVVFAAADARRRFLTANDELWQVFEPDLRRRLADLDRAESTADRVHAALLELLPAGRGSADAVARRLALSRRTLQRRLAAEATTFQAVLERTRHALARHYQARGDVTTTEIALLLGYDDPSSLHRATRRWTA